MHTALALSDLSTFEVCSKWEKTNGCRLLLWWYPDKPSGVPGSLKHAGIGCVDVNRWSTLERSLGGSISHLERERVCVCVCV